MCEIYLRTYTIYNEERSIDVVSEMIDDDAIAYVREGHPSYLACEAWVREHAAPDRLTPEGIAQFNERVLTFAKPEPARSETLDMLGLPADDTEWLGTDLNDLEDWHCFHLALLDDA